MRLGIAREHRPTAVDGYGCAVDEARIVREQVGNGGRDLLGAPHPADRMQQAHLFLDPLDLRRLLLLEERLVALRGDRAQRYEALTRMPRGP
jgi:hypothetical protein